MSSWLKLVGSPFEKLSSSVWEEGGEGGGGGGGGSLTGGY